MPPHQSPPPQPPATRKRQRSPSPHARAPTPYKKHKLEQWKHFLTRHIQNQLRLLRSRGGNYCNSNVYHSSRRICTHPHLDLSLFSRYDPLAGKTHVSWERCQYTIGRRLRIECSHKDGCNGFAQTKPQSLVGRFLRTCDCPDQVVFTDHVWMVDPREVEVQHVAGDGSLHDVRHGKRVEKLDKKL